ncbi:anti-sigma factor [Pedobacter sp. KBW06]|uniref:FecR family protein n=1 Tax=Pedobacter sp. KBW06 TaxID=2153359 RepID=UPI000F5A4251|nr:FecR family protein [Pedobacter sp. KBW06]RQO74817.1 anti-sigma factor [Pedobacter sp. KBW06]
MNKEELKSLLEKFDAGHCTAEEVGMLESWYLQWRTDEEIDLADAEAEQRIDHIWSRLDEEPEVQKTPLRLWPRFAAAAVILIALSSALFFYFHRGGSTPAMIAKQDVPAGGNKAYLTLADGKRIVLNDAANGQLAKETGVAISKSADGQLIYTLSDQGTAQITQPRYNKIETPKGGQYQVVLPDGTKVWLNSASSLRFPAMFTNLKTREVELNGEAYFEVAHNKKQPFIVKTARQELSVLGTHFNLSSYADEDVTKTTLLQGAVLIRRLGDIVNPVEGKDFAVLKPGQQATLRKSIQTGPADIEMATAWKEGNFLFKELDLKSILRQLSRWYDVEVDYSHVPENRFFMGFISRSVNLSKVLEMLEIAGGIQFEIDEKTIKVINLKH